MTIFRLTAATLFPLIFAVSFFLAEKKTGFAKLSYSKKQIIIGIVFGGIAVLATEFSIPVNGAMMNVRSAAPLTAGLLFGAPAGIIAGIIGGVERWLCVMWGGGEYTRIACTVATVMAGFFAAVLRKYMFENKKASWSAGLVIGLTTEVLHMLLVFMTNMSDIRVAFAVVEKCAPVMIPLNSVSVALALASVSLLGKEKVRTVHTKKQIAQIFSSGLMFCVVLGFAITCFFTVVLQTRLAYESTDSLLEQGIREVPQSIDEITDDTFRMYAEWIAVDIEGELKSNELLADLAEEYVVPEIHIISPGGIVEYSNQADLEGFVLSEDKQSELTSDGGYVSDYEASFYSSDVLRIYASVALDNSVVLVGYDEDFIADEIALRVQAVATSKHIGQNGFLIICDTEGAVLSSGREDCGKSLGDAGVSLDGRAEYEVFTASVCGEGSQCMYAKMSTLAGDYKVIAVSPESEAFFSRNIAVYITVFMEILVFAVLFINVYFLIKYVVVDNIHKVNTSLAKITGGNLEETVNVRENEEFASLTDDINSTVTTLKHYMAEAATRIDKELEFARAIQHSALPSVFPPYPSRKDFDLYALMETAKEVGGDFYDFYLLDKFHLVFLIADVSGEGIPAAMFMMTAKTVIKGFAESGEEADNIFTHANEKLCESNEAGMFVTAWIGILDLRSGLLGYANAGHNPPLIRHKNGSFDFLRTRPNFVLAGMDGVRYKKHELQMEPGDTIYLYTDGVTEAKNVSDKLFNEERLQDILNKNPDEGVEERCKNILQEVRTFAGEAEQFDDITMLSVGLNYLQTDNSIKVCPELASTDAVWGFIDAKTEKAGLSKKLANKVKICTDEIYSNIMRYSGAAKAQISYSVEDGLLNLVFRDNGIPYDPTTVKKPDISKSAEEREEGGLGIYIVRKYVHSISYRFADGQNILTLTFDISQ